MIEIKQPDYGFNAFREERLSKGWKMHERDYGDITLIEFKTSKPDGGDDVIYVALSDGRIRGV